MKQQILDILAELEKWRKVRKLSIESQREGYIRNVMEELGELAEAIKVEQNYKTMLADYAHYPLAFLHDNNADQFSLDAVILNRDLLLKYYGIEAYIDALCDIVVFAGNCVDKEKFGRTYIPDEFMEETLVEASETALLKGLLGNTYDMTYDPNTMIVSLYSFCRDLAAKKGYDFFKCMKETLKQINSRQGTWNENLKKWVKDTSDEAREKEYQADFSKCLLDKGK